MPGFFIAEALAWSGAGRHKRCVCETEIVLYWQCSGSNKGVRGCHCRFMAAMLSAEHDGGEGEAALLWESLSASLRFHGSQSVALSLVSVIYDSLICTSELYHYVPVDTCVLCLSFALCIVPRCLIADIVTVKAPRQHCIVFRPQVFVEIK